MWAAALVPLVASLPWYEPFQQRRCLPGTTDLINLTHMGESFPMKIHVGVSGTPQIVSAVYDILLREKVGIRTEMFDSFSGVHAMKTLGGCVDPFSPTMDDCPDTNAEVPPRIPDAFAMLETWTGDAPDMLNKLVHNSGTIGYTAKPGLWAFDESVSAMWRDHSVSLEWYQSLKHPDIMSYFDNYTTVMGHSGFEGGCKPGDPGYEHLAATGRGCTDDGWYLTDACADAPHACIPVVLVFYAWNGQQWIDKANELGLPFAVTWLGWDWIGAVWNSAFGKARFLFYWWMPDALFLPLRPKLVWFGDNHAIQQFLSLYKTSWKELGSVSPAASYLLSRIVFSDDQIRALLDRGEIEYKAKYGKIDFMFENTCKWVRDNIATWGPWLPDRVCPAGEMHVGIRGDQTCAPCPMGTYKQTSGNMACEKCPRGQYGDAVGLVQCRPCIPGTSAEAEGSTQCLACEPGTIAGQAGMHDCEPCPPGSAPASGERCNVCPIAFFASVAGTEACKPCPFDRTTEYSGTIKPADCFCPADTISTSGGQCESCGALSTTEGPGAEACVWASSAHILFTAIAMAFVFLPAFAVLLSQKLRKIQAVQIAAEKLHFREICNSSKDMQFPMVLISGESFLNEGSLLPYESSLARSMEKGGRVMHCIHSANELLVFLETYFVLFFSHQWVAWAHPDPESVQYECMTSALKSLIQRYRVTIKETYVWVDYTCITQLNALTLGLCINTLPLYSRHASAFVAVTPPTKHKDTDQAMDYASYQKRAWCRLEILTHHMLRGMTDMFKTDAEDKLTSYMESECELEDEVFYLFEGDLSCCAMKHRLAGKHIPCDKTKFVYPMLALYAHVYVGRHDSAHLRSFYQRCHKDLTRTFPPTFQYINPKGLTKKVLFGDKVRKLEKFLDGLAADDPLMETLRSKFHTTHARASVVGQAGKVPAQADLPGQVDPSRDF